MIVAKLVSAALAVAGIQSQVLAQTPTHGAQPAPPPAAAPAAGTTAAPAGNAPAHAAHGGMAMEGDPSIPGDSPRFKNVELKIVSPKDGEAVPSGDFDVVFKLTGYNIAGEQPGPHIHVIVDNQPYLPDFDASKPFHVSGLSPGAHSIRAFPSRPWHESIKAPKAFAMTHFFVGAKAKGSNFPTWPDAKKPMLVYSRPKGNYGGADAKKIMVDFWVKNAKLGPKDYKVKMVLDGQESMITEWQPRYLENLADGTHKITLDLLDKKGNPVENAFNHTEREFTVNAPGQPGTPAPAGPTTGAPDAGAAAAPDAGAVGNKAHDAMEKMMGGKK